MKAADIGVARRYARATLEVSLEKGNPAQLRKELDQSVALLQASKDLSAALTHPALAPELKKQIVAAVWGHGGSSEPLPRLLEMLVERHRLELLPTIASAFGALWNERRGVVSADVASAVPLSAAQAEGLAQAIGRVAGMQAELETRVDPELLGGVLLKLGGRVYDGSVRTRLRSLRAHLAGTTP